MLPHPLTQDCAAAITEGADAMRELRNLLCRFSDALPDDSRIDPWLALMEIAETANSLASDLYDLAWRVRRGDYDPHPVERLRALRAARGD